ncbi:MAG TPA: alternative ribosome rescue aminoacyl-tRNA hydrolase ArfB [Terriglobia bacterium]|nr:alternative ribosome rescue aminoacyl-tRNA hydrolase ArfB [Terriglobia bacterium]
MIAIMAGVEIPENELEFIASRSGGPGGQNVNKVSSRITLRFDLERTTALSDEQRARIRAKLASRISNEGVLQISSQRTRSQELNREDALSRFAELLRDALRVEKARVKTKATRASHEGRLKEKKERTSVKRARAIKGSRAWDE